MGVKSSNKIDFEGTATLGDMIDACHRLLLVVDPDMAVRVLTTVTGRPRSIQVVPRQ